MRRRFAKLLIRCAARLLTDSEAAAALDHITVSARLCGWPEGDAYEAARHMLRAGVSPLAAQRLFDEAERYVQ